MSTKRNSNHGLRKVCGCSRRRWAECSYGWHFNYKPRGGVPYRLSLDRYRNRRITDKTEAEREAARIRIAIDEGTFGLQAPQRDVLTLRQLAEHHRHRDVDIERAATRMEYVYSRTPSVELSCPSRLEGRQPWDTGALPIS